jgi:protein-S-isoprenylcysteine O-methyltransferase Ste14
MKRESLAPLVFVLTALAAMAVSLWTRSSIPVSRDGARLLGGAIFLLGMALFAWSAAFLKAAFLGEVEPTMDRLIHNGPYGSMRHPLYLGMIISLFGIAVALRSLWGIAAVTVLFFPAVLWRAGLEEKALARRFDQAWKEYRRKTGFLFPRLSKDEAAEKKTEDP